MATAKRLNGANRMDDEEAIDFEKLDREVAETFQRDARYWQENDAKMRALRQKVGSYEEFRQIVLASHLKPIEKDESLTDCTKKASIFNSVANTSEVGGVSGTVAGSADYKLQTRAQIQSKEDFVKQWKAARDASSRWTLLSQCSVAELANAFRVEIPSNVFSEILKCITEHLQSSDDGVTFIAEFLLASKSFGRFSILNTFLSADDKSLLQNILSFLSQKQETAVQVQVQEIRSIFCLK